MRRRRSHSPKIAKTSVRKFGALTIAMLACLATGCASGGAGESGAEGNGWFSAFAAMTGAPSLDQIVEKLSSEPPQATREKLKELLDHPGISQATKQEASYVLGKLLKKDWSPVGISGQTDETYTTMVGLFKNAAKFAPLSSRSSKHLLDIATKAADDAQVRECLRVLKAAAKTPEDKAYADYTLAQTQLKAGEYDAAQQLFQLVKTEAPTSKYSYGASYYIADQILKVTPQPTQEAADQAILLFKDYLKNAPDGRFAPEIAGRLESLAQAGTIQLTPADYDVLAKAYYNFGNWSNALKAWDRADSGKNLFLRSIALMHVNRHDDARATLITAIKNDPTSRSYSAAGALLSNPLTKAQAFDLWKACLAAAPVHADAALWNVALRSDGDAGIPYYREIIKKFPTSEFAAESSWWLFWHEAKSGDKKRYPAAIQLGTQASRQYPETRQAARLLFWIGKLQERLGQKGMAINAYTAAFERFPSNYYGYRARHRLAALKAGGNDAGWSTKTARPHPQPHWSWPEPEIPAAKAGLETPFDPTFMVLFRLNQWDECLELLPSTAPRSLKSALYAKQGLNLEAIGAASKGADGKPVKNDIWLESYPLEFGQHVAENASARGVDPLLVHALIREESRYNPKAVSRSHALGLMQLLVGTAYGSAKKVGITLSGESDITRPEVNVKLGTYYLSYAIQRFGGNAMLGVASYNGGPGAVGSWMRRHSASGGDFDLFVENIPFRETRDYVRKVFGSYWTYQALYGK
ncbi:MAG: transglycosylase SLT domain-containing protein [Candidatus Melainabacteria bacterium]|nr:transglycosylase SLT domain-containing protein [Candidatus Melainabacteria bacterium]